MRVVKPEPEVLEWERLGWTREPRNGREWRMVRAGLPMPKVQGRPFRCRKNQSHRRFKVESGPDGREVRRCSICGPRRARRFYRKNREKTQAYGKKYRRSNRAYRPELIDGCYTVSGTWAAEHPVLIAEMVKLGTLVVEIYGEPAYAIVSLEKAR